MRYKIEISYDGSGFYGFQKQPNKETIQECLEKAISQVLKQNIEIVGCGRTDAGVSAISAVCHFDYDKEIDSRNFIGHTNNLLPNLIKVRNISKVNDEFHARYSAKSKTYDYYFYIDGETPFYDKFATNIGYNISIEKMKNACKYFVGEHDFSSFCASNTSVVDKTRIIYDIEIIELGNNLYKLSIRGNGFLYNMVRIIMGTLVDVGLGKIQPENINDIILCKNRAKAGKTINSKGLVLKKIDY